ncbi:TIGR02677 family protein [Candidatus Contubernalis alkaliaceticus]|uniref:TIGR02677 family protein n=1 Tax=Candidatus Contubernalis alkaliaceticus TaxID=338645 RepID=UPI001F4BE8F1|nr:TIGR02677 family protein [Candidatus Contubernalis alkalaceticus]UNC91163.1 TIGR02677 family protein [Candidatus Contubernalis alkalaceticus]
MDAKLFQPIVEVNYLTAGNVWRYRAILRYFYIQHERLRHYLFPEEILDYLKQSLFFQDYSQEQLQQDLNQLVEWKNLIPRQDMGKVSTIEEFKRKKFRYQCTPYTVEIERMVQALEQKGDSFGGSLEKTLFDRLLDGLIKISSSQAVQALPPEELNGIWEDIYDNFRKLTENATDYLAHLESEKVEEMMMTEAFLVYKDAITGYLRSFMSVLQRISLRIESLLREMPAELIRHITEKLAEYYLSIPRLEETPSKEEVAGKYFIRWQSMCTWFLGSDGRESDLVYLQSSTNETIRRITRFAQRIGEKHHNFKSRRKDYLHLANCFVNCQDLQEAHELSACVFGVSHTRHIYSRPKETEDIYVQIWDQPATVITVNPRVRNYREKTRPRPIISHRQEKERLLAQYLQEKEAEQKLIEQMIKKDRIILSELSFSDPYIRKTILNWIGRCMGSRQLVAKTETGRKFRLSKIDDRRITLPWEDGSLQLPNYMIQFLE